MNCVKHPALSAVTQCAVCGVGMCPECAYGSEYKVDNRPICRNCNREMTADKLRKNTIEHRKTIFRVVACGAGIVLGLIAFRGGMYVFAVILFALGGFPTAWRRFKTTAEERLHNKMDDSVADLRHGIGFGLVNAFIRFVVRIAFVIVFATVAAPILLITGAFKLFKLRREMERNRAVMATNFERDEK